jgi:riboflavin synthase
MFTGIIQAVGHIERSTPIADDIKLTINAGALGLDDVKIGDSIAVNGICLTATHLTPTHFEAHVSKATLAVTVGLNHDITAKNSVNLEKALCLHDRLGGHLVSGHVDGVGEVTQFEAVGDCWLLSIRAPRAISKYIAKKGSVAVNGVSLTVNAVSLNNFDMNIIPHTLQNTSFGELKLGSLVNLEVDQIARYVERMHEWAKEEK